MSDQQYNFNEEFEAKKAAHAEIFQTIARVGEATLLDKWFSDLICDKNDSTAITYAAVKGHRNVVRLLLEKTQVNVLKESSLIVTGSKRKPLELIVKLNDTHLVSLAIDKSGIKSDHPLILDFMQDAAFNCDLFRLEFMMMYHRNSVRINHVTILVQQLSDVRLEKKETIQLLLTYLKQAMSIARNDYPTFIHDMAALTVAVFNRQRLPAKALMKELFKDEQAAVLYNNIVLYLLQRHRQPGFMRTVNTLIDDYYIPSSANLGPILIEAASLNDTEFVYKLLVEKFDPDWAEERKFFPDLSNIVLAQTIAKQESHNEMSKIIADTKWYKLATKELMDRTAETLKAITDSAPVSYDFERTREDTTLPSPTATAAAVPAVVVALKIDPKIAKTADVVLPTDMSHDLLVALGCVICSERQRMCYPPSCSHLCLCCTCCIDGRLDTCPICRASVNEWKRMFG